MAFLNLTPTNTTQNKYITADKIYFNSLYKSPYFGVGDKYAAEARDRFKQKLFENKSIAEFDLDLFHKGWDKFFMMPSVNLIPLFDNIGELRDRGVWNVIKYMYLCDNPLVKDMYPLFNILYGIQVPEGRLPKEISEKSAVITNPVRSYLQFKWDPVIYTGDGNDFSEITKAAHRAYLDGNYLQIPKESEAFQAVYNGVLNRLNQDKVFAQQTGFTNYKAFGNTLSQQIEDRLGIIIRGVVPENILWSCAQDLLKRNSGSSLNGTYEYGADFTTLKDHLGIEVKSYRTADNIITTGKNKYHHADFVLCLIRQDLQSINQDKSKGKGNVGASWKVLRRLDNTHYEEVNNFKDCSIVEVLNRLPNPIKPGTCPEFKVSLDPNFGFQIYCLDRPF